MSLEVISLLYDMQELKLLATKFHLLHQTNKTSSNNKAHKSLVLARQHLLGSKIAKYLHSILSCFKSYSHERLRTLQSIPLFFNSQFLTLLHNPAQKVKDATTPRQTRKTRF